MTEKEDLQTLKVSPRPLSFRGALQWLIVAGMLICFGIYLFTPSTIMEYRVELSGGIYLVKGIVRYGNNFVSYQAVEGEKAIQVCNDLNQELMKDRGMTKFSKTSYGR